MIHFIITMVAIFALFFWDIFLLTLMVVAWVAVFGGLAIFGFASGGVLGIIGGVAGLYGLIFGLRAMYGKL